MKHIYFLALIYFLSLSIHSHIPNTDWILSRLAHHCFVKHPSFKCTYKVKNQTFFATSSFNEEEISIFSLHKPKNEGEETKLNIARFSLGIYKILLGCGRKSKNDRLDSLKNYLHESDVDTTIVSLGFYNNIPAYIIGAKPNELAKPHLIVDKDNFHLLREVQEGFYVNIGPYKFISELGIKMPLTLTWRNDRLHKLSISHKPTGE